MYDSITMQVIDDVVEAIAFSDLAFDQFYKTYGISRVQFRALFYILKDEEKGIILSGLGEKLFVSKSNITTLIDRMEAGGLVKRKPDENDRRIIQVIATEKGKKIVNLILPKLNEFTDEIFSCLTEQEVETVKKIFQKLRNHIQCITSKSTP